MPVDGRGPVVFGRSGPRLAWIAAAPIAIGDRRAVKPSSADASLIHGASFGSSVSGGVRSTTMSIPSMIARDLRLSSDLYSQVT